MFKGDKYLVLLPISQYVVKIFLSWDSWGLKPFLKENQKYMLIALTQGYFFFFTDTLNLSKCPFIKLIKKKTTLSKSEVGGLLISKSGTPKKSNDRRPCSFEIVYFKNKTSFLVCKWFEIFFHSSHAGKYLTNILSK